MIPIINRWSTKHIQSSHLTAWIGMSCNQAGLSDGLIQRLIVSQICSLWSESTCLWAKLTKCFSHCGIRDNLSDVIDWPCHIWPLKIWPMGVSTMLAAVPNLMKYSILFETWFFSCLVSWPLWNVLHAVDLSTDCWEKGSTSLASSTTKNETLSSSNKEQLSTFFVYFTIKALFTGL